MVIGVKSRKQECHWNFWGGGEGGIGGFLAQDGLVCSFVWGALLLGQGQEILDRMKHA